MEQISDIKFSCNWNGKLNCTAFTTLRRKHYRVGERLVVKLNGNEIKTVLVKEKRTFDYTQITEFEAYQDTGYSKEATIKILEKMYPDLISRFSKEREINLYLLVSEGKKSQQPSLFNNETEEL